MFAVIKLNVDGSLELIEANVFNREEAEYIVAEQLIENPKDNFFIEKEWDLC